MKKTAVYYRGLLYAFELLTFFTLIYLQKSVFNITMNDNNSTYLGLTDFHARILEERGQGTGPPLKIHKTIGFLSNTGLDPLKNHKATKPAFHVRPTSAFRWRADGGTLVFWYLDPSSPHQLKNHKKKQRQSWAPLWQNSGSAHDLLTVVYSKLHCYTWLNACEVVLCLSV